MHRFAPLLAAILLTWSAGAMARGPVTALIQKLENGVDFRVRVQAALDLGKSKVAQARPPLEAALDDDNAAVRAAAAAALKVMGDPAAIQALQRHKKDSSPAVRAQIKNTIDSLAEALRRKTEDKAEVFVQIGKIRNGSAVHSRSVITDAQRASRKKLDELPGVDVVDKPPPVAKRKKRGRQPPAIPVVMVTGRVKELAQSREGSSVVYSASIEFVLHSMPGQAIKGIVSGSARAKGAARDMGDRRAMADLRRTALEAAIESAVRRAPQALRAAADL